MFVHKFTRFAAFEQSNEAPTEEAMVADTTIAPPGEGEVPELSAKEKEIARLRAAEKFVVKSTGSHECRVCGFVYDESAQGTGFKELPSSWRCPQCLSQKGMYTPITTTIAGFEENQEYGFGSNKMTGDDKNLLIFGGLGVGFVLMLSGYLLD